MNMPSSSQQPTTRQPDQAILVGWRLRRERPVPAAGTTYGAGERPQKPSARAAARVGQSRSGLNTLTELAIRVLAFTSIAAIILIFVFIGKEAWPLLHDSVIGREVTLAKMWFAQQWPGYDAPEHVWQPVSRVSEVCGLAARGGDLEGDVGRYAGGRAARRGRRSLCFHSTRAADCAKLSNQRLSCWRAFPQWCWGSLR